MAKKIFLQMRDMFSVEMWFYRRKLRLSWKENVVNEEVLSRVRRERLLLDIVRDRHWKSVGNVLGEV